MTANLEHGGRMAKLLTSQWLQTEHREEPERKVQGLEGSLGHASRIHPTHLEVCCPCAQGASQARQVEGHNELSQCLWLSLEF